MTRYGSVLAFLVCQALLLRGQAFQPLQSQSQPRSQSGSTTGSVTTQRHISASSFRDYADIESSDHNNNQHNVVENSNNPLEAAWNATSQYMDALAEPTAEDLTEAAAATRRLAVEARLTQGGATYKVTLPLMGSGLSIGQVVQQAASVNGKNHRVLQDVELDLDSFKMVNVPQQTFMRAQSSLSSSGSGNSLQQHQQKERIEALPEDLDRNFAGCLVTAVLKDSAAWNQGVRPGDVLVATSATLGEGMWPKSNLVGVQSALSSRAAMADKFTLELQTPAVALVAAEKELDNRYELSIARPTGLQIQDSADGYVVVTAIAENAPVVVQYAVQVGDRVLAVDSALGDRLWPVSTTEGVISACTSRLPGQAVRMRFERPRANMVKSSTTTTPVVKSTTVSRQATSAANKMSTSGNAAAVLAKAPVNQRDLLKRCREVLRRYAEKGNEQTSVGARFMGKYAVPAIVADKVVDALASASVAIDSVTLSMIMSAYLSCRQPEDAIRIFEAAVGLPADGSTEAMTDAVINGKNGGKIVPSESALNLFTATAVLQAHALTGDIASVSRVLASLEGRSGVDVCGVKSAPWPWTGKYGSIQPDTQCYNIAIASAAKLGGEQGVDTALILLEQMNDASKTKDIVTYNTLISALTKLGRSDEAFALFEKMKRAGIRPDKFTYTSLIKLCSDDDVQELLFDMQERGVQADVVTYNSVIKSLCQDWKWTQATKLVNEMESRGISPDSMTYGLLMNGMLKAGKAGACLTLFESACASDRSVSLTENVHLYTTAITAAAVLGDHERALEFVSRMTAIGVKPNLKTLTAVMGACMSSGRFDLATQIYKRIDSPDGFAMSQGLRALCETGDVASAAAILYKLPRRTREMTGKQIMLSYKTAIEAALKENDFETARDVLSDLLKKGYIPNKAIFLSMTQSIQFESAEEEGATAAVERFTFLLFVIDSIQKRSLPVDASLYSSTLLLGNQNGGVTRRIASLLAKAKTTAQTGSKELLSSPDMDKEGLTQGWEHLQLHYDSSSESSTDSMLPPLSVRVSAREMRKVLSAEQAVTFAPRNKPRKQQRTAPPRPQQ